VKGSSSRIGHKSKGRSKGRSALCSPCTDVSPSDGGLARSRLGECGEVTSIIVTGVGTERAGASESHSGSAPSLAELMGRPLTTVAVTVVTGGTFGFTQFGPPPSGPHRSNDVRSRPRSWCTPRRQTRRTSERSAGAANAVARRRKVDDDQGGPSFPLLPRG